MTDTFMLRRCLFLMPFILMLNIALASARTNTTKPQVHAVNLVTVSMQYGTTTRFFGKDFDSIVVKTGDMSFATFMVTRQWYSIVGVYREYYTNGRIKELINPLVPSSGTSYIHKLERYGFYCLLDSGELKKYTEDGIPQVDWVFHMKQAKITGNKWYSSGILKSKMAFDKEEYFYPTGVLSSMNYRDTEYKFNNQGKLFEKRFYETLGGAKIKTLLEYYNSGILHWEKHFNFVPGLNDKPCSSWHEYNPDGTLKATTKYEPPFDAPENPVDQDRGPFDTGSDGVVPAMRMPEYPNGEQAFYRHVKAKLKFKKSKKNPLPETIHVRFIVDQNGMATFKLVTEQIPASALAEIQQLFEDLPKFLPGLERGIRTVSEMEMVLKLGS